MGYFRAQTVLRKFWLVVAPIVYYVAISSHSYAQDSALAKKEDGRFRATLSQSFFQQPYVSSVELYLEWWGLLGQPVEYYKFKWTLQAALPVTHRGEDRTLARHQLEKYPDLLERYDALKPSDIELTFDAVFDAHIRRHPMGRFSEEDLGRLEVLSKIKTYFNCPQPMAGSRSVIGNCINPRAIKTVRKTPHLMIVRSGEVGDNISPGSPRNWASFIDWSLDEYTSDDELNDYAQNTLRETQSITFSNLRIKSVEFPEFQVNNLYEAYLERERDEEENGKPETEEGDFWGGDETEEKEAGDEGFWSGDAEPQNDTDTDFWKGETVKEAASADFWSEMVPGASDGNDFEIKDVDGKQGVFSADGQTLIPFRDWTVLSYRAGIAKVQLQEYPNGSRCKGWRLSLNITTQGLVDNSGNWLTEPQQIASAHIVEDRSSDLVIRIERHPADETEAYRQGLIRAEERKRAERLACKSDLRGKRDAFQQEYRMKGYDIE